MYCIHGTWQLLYAYIYASLASMVSAHADWCFIISTLTRHLSYFGLYYFWLFEMKPRNENIICGKIEWNSSLLFKRSLLQFWSDFLKLFEILASKESSCFFSLPLVNFASEKHTIWKILMKMWSRCLGSCKYLFDRFNWTLKPRFIGWWCIIWIKKKKKIHPGKLDHACWGSMV